MDLNTLVRNALGHRIQSATQSEHASRCYGALISKLNQCRNNTCANEVHKCDMKQWAQQ